MSDIKSIDAIIQSCEDEGAADIDRICDMNCDHGRTLNFIYGHAVTVKHEIKSLKQENERLRDKVMKLRLKVKRRTDPDIY